MGLPISKDEFDDAKQQDFKQSIANAAGVAVQKIEIKGIQSTTIRRALSSASSRHLLAQGIKIDVEVTAADGSAAASMAGLLTADNINAQLEAAGLPKAQILSAPEIVQPNPQNPSIENEEIDGKDSSKSIEMWYIVIGVVIFIIVIFIAVFMIITYRKRALTAKNITTPLSNAVEQTLGGGRRLVTEDGLQSVDRQEIETTTHTDPSIRTDQDLSGTNSNCLNPQLNSNYIQDDSWQGELSPEASPAALTRLEFSQDGSNPGAFIGDVETVGADLQQHEVAGAMPAQSSAALTPPSIKQPSGSWPTTMTQLNVGSASVSATLHHESMIQNHEVRASNVDKMEISSPAPVMMSEESRHASAKLVYAHSAEPSQTLDILGISLHEDIHVVDEEVGQAGSRPFNVNVVDTMSLQAAIKAKMFKNKKG